MSTRGLWIHWCMFWMLRSAQHGKGWDALLYMAVALVWLYNPRDRA